MISDTTISAAKGCGSEMKDKFRMNFKIAFPAALVNNTIGIIATCPMAKEIGQRYGIAPKRLASLVDIFACAFLAMMPHDGGMMIVAELAGVSPISIMSHSYYMFFLVAAACITIHFGLMQTEEERAGNKE